MCEFDRFFSNCVASAKTHLTGKGDSFHLLGLSACAFLEAALGIIIESGPMIPLLTLSEAGARGQVKVKPTPPSTSARARKGRQTLFPLVLEWEILGVGTIALLGLTNALRCM